MPTLTELTGESDRIDWRRPQQERPRPRRDTRPGVEFPMSNREIVATRHDVRRAFERSPERPDTVLDEVPPVEEFDTAYERFELKDKPDRAALERRERALAAVADVMKWSSELDACKARGEPGSDRLRANIAAWQKDVEAFLAACTARPNEADVFWKELESRFQASGGPGIQEFAALQPGLLGELALKRLYCELGYEVRDNPLTDPFGIDFLTRQPPTPGYGGMYPGGIEIQQVKSHQVNNAQEAAAIAGHLVERMPFGEVTNTNRPDQENAELRGWGQFFKRFGPVVPGVRHHLPFRDKLIAANGEMNAQLKALVKAAILKKP